MCIASVFPEILEKSTFIDTVVALFPFIQHFLRPQNAAFVIKRSHVGSVKASDFKRPLSFPRKLDLLAEGEQRATQTRCCSGFKS